MCCFIFSAARRVFTRAYLAETKRAQTSPLFFFGCCVLSAATYPFETLYNKNAYEQQFDAFLKHRLSIDIEPAKELLALSNPYDRASRTGIRFLWDRALYDGKYYSYFGITPIITVYYPYYFITGKVPSICRGRVGKPFVYAFNKCRYVLYGCD